MLQSLMNSRKKRRLENLCLKKNLNANLLALVEFQRRKTIAGITLLKGNALSPPIKISIVLEVTLCLLTDLREKSPITGTSHSLLIDTIEKRQVIGATETNQSLLKRLKQDGKVQRIAINIPLQEEEECLLHPIGLKSNDQEEVEVLVAQGQMNGILIVGRNILILIVILNLIRKRRRNIKKRDTLHQRIALDLDHDLQKVRKKVKRVGEAVQEHPARSADNYFLLMPGKENKFLPTARFMNKLASGFITS